jgi:hypothetical protein
MPVHVNPQGRFTVSFFRGDEVLDARTARTGELAVKVAILMLAELDALQHGDRVTVKKG